MNVLICIAKVPDTTTKITFTDNNTKFNTERVQWVINPLDEFALTRAIEIKEELGGTITVINVGLADTEPLIRKAFAIGADEGIRINAEPTDCFFVASQIAHYAKEGNYDYIFAGRETTDYEGAQVGGIVAEMMGIPFIAGVPKFDYDGTTATMEREIEGGKEVISLNPPFLASIQEGVTEPRIPSMRGIMSARTKPLTVVEPVEAGSFVGVNSYELPPAKGECKYVEADNAEELINLLHNEAKVI
ncbi:MAG: electron transfer flavoprotein subunit alpha [Bacteroidetes bacterium]|nr:MAG: electron transfer flavoprotein subunit alpha [Bacteroidota bacterium]